MRRPLILLNRSEGSATASGLAERTREGWALRRGLGAAASLLLSPSGSYDRNGPVEPTITGGVIIVPGQYGPAWLVAEATTNLLTGVANNWHTSRELLAGEFPAATWRVTVTGEAGDEGIDFRQNTSAKGEITLTYSIDVRADAPLEGLALRVFRQWEVGSDVPWSQRREYGSVTNEQISLTDDWQRVTMTTTLDDRSGMTGAVTHISCWVASTSATSFGRETSWYVRNPQLEAKRNATPFTVGTRQYGTVHLDDNPVQDRPAYEVLLRGRFLYRYIVGTVLGDSSHRLRYEPDGAVSLWDGAARGGAYRIAPGNAGVVGISFDGTDTTIIVNGQKERIAGLDYRSGGRFAIGYTGGDYVANMLVEGVIAFDRPLTDAERAHVLGMDRAWEWGDDGALTVPVTGTPGEVYVRYRTRGLERVAVRTGPGPIGDAGTLAISAGRLTITAERDDLEVLEVVAFAEPLSPWDRATVLNARTWTADLFESRISVYAEYEPGVVHQRPTTLVTISGVPTPVDSWTTRHGVNQPIGTASITVPLGGDVSHIDLNATVEIQAGYRDEPTRRVFLGRIADIERRYGIDGADLRLQCEDWMTLLRYPLEEDLVYAGRIRLDHLFRSLAELRGMPQIEVAPTRDANGLWISFGGVPAIDDGDLVLKRRSGPLTFMTSKAKLFGYRVFGKPSGPAALARISGIPAARPVHTFVQGLDLIEVGEDRTVRPMVTNWTVYGARYTDDDGVTIELRSIPKVVPPNPYLDPPGWASDDISDSILTRQQLVDAVREVHEIDRSAPEAIAPWTSWGRPEIEPGDVVAVHAPGAGIDEPSVRWVMSVDHRWSRSGFTSSFTGWAGAGRALEAGIDQQTIPVGTGPYRLGDEWLTHYVIPAPNPGPVTIPFTVPATYTSLALTGRQHGTNSYLQDGANTEITVSQLEVWQGGERVGSAQLPVSEEHLLRRYDYRDRRYWTEFRMPIPGTLEPGPAEMRIVAGKLPGGGGIDDFEVEHLAIEARGTGAAILPGRRP